MSKGGHRRDSLIKLFVGILAAVVLVIASGFAFQRFDLTEEKRHSLTDSSIELLEGLEDIVFVKVYLKGEYPAEYKRLERSIQERLDEMKAYAGDNLEYEFVNPSESSDEKVRNEMYSYLQEAGLQYTNITFQTKDGGRSEKILFPGALVTYRDKTMPMQLLKSSDRVVDVNMLSKSINNLEYEFSHIMRRITSRTTPSIAFIHGHGELDPLETNDAEMVLSESYAVNRVEMDGGLNALTDPTDEEGLTRINKYDMIIIASPTEEFSDADKFHIDQFVMRGGKVMWFLDPVDANLDSLRSQQQSMGRARQLNIEDLLFNYGVRLNHNLLIDAECADIVITVGMVGNRPQYKKEPWYFKPIMTPYSGHPIVSNIDPVEADFVSSIDLIDRPDISKTVLLTTSENTRILRAPVRINLNIVTIDPDFKDKKRPFQNVAVLLEGKFKSPLSNLISPKFMKAGFKTLSESKPTSMLVVSDGDLIKNKVSADGQNFFPLGYDRYAQDRIYGNREFLLNAVNYMLDDAGLISVRSRTIELRKMDEEKLLRESSALQALNVGLPVLIILLLGVILSLVRNRRYKRG